MAATESIRIRVEPEFKERVTEMYAQRGTSVSAAVRRFLTDELAEYSSALSAFDAIMDSADRKIEASGLAEPSIDDINAYVARIRAERADQSLAARAGHSPIDHASQSLAAS